MVIKKKKNPKRGFMGFSMSERGFFFSASNEIKTLDGNIFSEFPWLTAQLVKSLACPICVFINLWIYFTKRARNPKMGITRFHKTLT